LDHRFRRRKSSKVSGSGGGIAHDFNNLLTVVLGNASLARMDLPPGSPVQTYLQQIEQTSQRAAELCRQMLAYSGKGKFVVQRIDLSQLIEDTTPLLRLSVSKKAVLRFELARKLPSVLVDVTQLRQIIMNLVINASDALGDQSGVISLSTGLRESGSAVSGQEQAGFGFVRRGLHVSWKSATAAAGCRRKRWRGFSIHFSPPNSPVADLVSPRRWALYAGTRGPFMSRANPALARHSNCCCPLQMARPSPLDQAPAAEDSWRGSGTILVVDDEETVRTVAARMLESFGFEVVLAADGREAISRFAEESPRFAAVLLDLTMPQMGGDEAFRVMRQLRSDVS